MNRIFFLGGGERGWEGRLVWEAWEIMYFNHTANANPGWDLK